MREMIRIVNLSSDTDADHRMYSNMTNTTNKLDKPRLLHPDLSYTLNGLCFSVHNELGRHCREKQYADALEEKLKAVHMDYERECTIGESGNTLDFLIKDTVALELKATPHVTKEHYQQLQRYLRSSVLDLGLIVNFRQRYLKPYRVIRTHT